MGRSSWLVVGSIRQILFLSQVAILPSLAFGQAGGKARETEDPSSPPPALPVFGPHPHSTAAGEITLRGRAADSLQVEVSSTLARFLVPVLDDEFAVRVPLETNRANLVFVTGISFRGVRSAAVATTVVQDQQAPSLFIDVPPDGSELTTATVDVAGRVGDVLSGSQGLTVTVSNGAGAFLADVDVGVGTNGTYLARSIPLHPAGQPRRIRIAEKVPTLLTVTATDAVGNSVSKQITVHQIAIPVGVPRMEVVSGNGQTRPVRSLLPEPLVVHVMNGDGSDFANKIVTFEVTRSDGRLVEARFARVLEAGSPGPVTGFPDKRPLEPRDSLRVQTKTDQQGIARVYWFLGSDAGCGNNRVDVISRDIAGSVFFRASATAAAPSQIAVGSGNLQVVETGTAAPQPLRVWLSDGLNPVSNSPVVFNVVEGGGQVAGRSMAVVMTDLTGHAQVGLVLGPNGGQNRVEATFPGNPGLPVTFTAIGLARSAGNPTTFVGLVLDNSSRPIQGAIASLTIGDASPVSVPTDLDGRFQMQGIEAGAGHLHVDGSTAFHVGGADPDVGEDVPPGSFPALEYQVVVVPAAVNTLPMPVLLPPLDPLNTVCYDASLGQDVELKIFRRDQNNQAVEVFEGLRFVVQAGTKVTLPDGTVIGPNSGKVFLSLNQVHSDEIPMPMPDGAAPPFAWTLRPTNAVFDPPIRLEFPNMAGLPAGSSMYFLNFDHGTNRFEIVASGKVTPDGSKMVSDPGSGIEKAGWGGFCPPYPDTGNVGGGPNPDGDPLDSPNEEPPSCSEPYAAPGSDPCEGEGGSNPPCGVGDPVYLFSGELQESAVDLRIKGRGLDFIWARKYRSQSGPNTAMGNGWDFSYNISLFQDAADIRLGDGNTRLDIYRFLAPVSIWLKQGVFRELTQNPDGTYTLLFENKGKWNFRALDGSPAAGKIASIVDRNGNTLSFDYDASGRLVTIHDTLDTPAHNRDITIAYGADGFIDSVTDFAGRQVVYDHYMSGSADGSPGDLRSVRTPIVVGTPTGNDFPAGKTTVYTYSTGFADERLNHNLLTITDPRGQTYVQNIYSTTQAPMDPDFDRVVRQIWGNAGDIQDFVYVPLSPVAANNLAVVMAIVNDRVGNVSEHFFNDLNVEVLTREYTGRADPDLPTTETLNRPMAPLRAVDPAFYETRRTYNRDRLMTSLIEPDGSTTTFLFEGDLDPNADRRAAGNLRTRIEVPGSLQVPADQGAIVEIFEYDSGFGSGCCGFNFVTRHVDGRGNETRHEYDAAGNRTRTIHRIPSIVEEFAYNAFGQRTLHRHPDNGSGHRREDVFNYYSSGPQLGYMQEAVVDATGFGLTTTYEYDLVGNVARVVDPRGNDTTYTLNSLDQVVRTRSRQFETFPGSGSFVRYERDLFYDANDNVVRLDVQNVNEAGTIVAANPYLSTLLEYEILNNVSRICREVGTFDVPRSPVPKLDCTGLPAAQFLTTEYTYDENRNLSLVRFGEAVEGRQPANLVRMLHDERDLLYRRIRAEGDPSQSTDQFDYDPNGNLHRHHQGLESSPRVSITDHDGFDRPVRMTDAMGNVTAYHYDANGNLLSVQADGELLDVSGSAGNRRLASVDYAYDAQDRLTSESVAFFERDTGNSIGDGQAITTHAYTDNSQIRQVTNDNLHLTTIVYDDANRPAVITDAKGNTRTYTYDGNSNVVAVLETDRSDLGGPDELFTTTYSHDGLDRLVQEVDNVGNTTQYRYDSRNNVTISRDPLTNLVRYLFDSTDRLTATIRDMDGDGPDGDGLDIVTLQTWDDSNRLRSQTDDNNNRTRYAYDALDRLIVTQMADGTLHQVGAGAVWSLANGQPDLTSFSSGYDPHDDPVTTLDANGTRVTNTYDLLDRLVARAIIPGPGVSSDTTFETYAYDGTSSLNLAQDDDSLVSRRHDSLDQVIAETLNGQTTTCLYDGVGNMVSCTYPSGRVIAHTYDSLERTQNIVDASGAPQSVATYQYVGPNRVAQLDYGNNTRCTYAYDGITGVPNPPGDFGVKRPIATQHVSNPGPSEVVIDHRAYTWDKLYNKTKRSDLRAGGPQLTHEYAYDPAYRLIGTTVRDSMAAVLRTTTYTLDGAGNRLQVQGNPDPGLYTSDATLPEPADSQVNQYTTTPFDGRSYDKNGNLTEIDPAMPAQRLITYDYLDHMVSYSAPTSSLTAAYRYDALGRRTERLVNSGGPATIKYFYTGDRVCEEQDALGTLTATYVYGIYIDAPLQMQRSGGASSFYHSDDLYNVTVVTNLAAVPAERYEYEDFGRPSFFDSNGSPLPSSNIANPYLFTGRHFDDEDGRYYYRSRYLDPRSGRFTSRDRIGTWADQASMGGGYTYAANNPMTLTDPSGFKTCCGFLPGQDCSETGVPSGCNDPQEIACAEHDRCMKDASGLRWLGFAVWNDQVAACHRNLCRQSTNKNMRRLFCGVDWWLHESVVPGPFGQPVSEWKGGKPTGWGDPIKYTDQAGGLWQWGEYALVGLAAAPATYMAAPILNNNPILRIGPGWKTMAEGTAKRIWRVASGGRWGKGGPKLPWHWHWP